MSLFTRAKDMIVTPKTEWAVIAAEEPNADAIFMRYVLPLVLSSAAAGFTGYTIIWHEGLNEFFWRDGSTQTDALFNRGLSFGIQTAIIGALGVWLAAIVVNALAQDFGSEKNMGRAMQLMCYSYTPVWIAGLLMLYPPVGIIGSLFGLYGLYLLYLGLPQLMKTPPEKTVPYTLTSIGIMLVIYIGLGLLFRYIIWDMIISFLKNVLINAHPLK